MQLILLLYSNMNITIVAYSVRRHLPIYTAGTYVLHSYVKVGICGYKRGL
jgi:uncharacterized membrane protein YhfC